SVQPYMSRYVQTQVADNRTTLLRVLLDGGCQPGPACGESSTCSYGHCVDDFVSPDMLEDYSPDCATYSYCKPKGAGPPTFARGTGDFAYKPLHDNDTVSLNNGSQGGHHVWISVWMKNLTQSSKLTLFGQVPGQSLDVGPYILQEAFYD